ncbi:MAG: hypothetical protein NVSMB68_08860 [Thermoanaerobaculia bacterium]
MDLFPVDQSGQPGPQNHAYDPGLGTNGTVWIASIPPSSVSVDLMPRSVFGSDDCRKTSVVSGATLNVTDLAVFDWVTNKNSLTNNTAPRQDAKVAFNIQWSNVIKIEDVTDPANTFRGSFAETGSIMQWSSKNQDGFEFHSDPSTAAQREFALVGHEQNGVYFNQRNPGERWGR